MKIKRMHRVFPMCSRERRIFRSDHDPQNGSAPEMFRSGKYSGGLSKKQESNFVKNISMSEKLNLKNK